ncbi:hypothetical protein LEP1GSC203_2220 [Leptospira terpstrae serovar Hualin str. LT 11-33 = ATCC 700639]|uniref:Uncharacterized protein n=1 Tax=Leptospira terpstrae serovar Hualin str. LT 11-33 = ATCC 700639 TaxID=1257025 RepID=N1VZA0_9LEPT|nr:hypothetical protein LEP1GSC203_2220 [Leptospira terpstrae serovar Hualin str. LT 11-33 = ATCC 700639]
MERCKCHSNLIFLANWFRKNRFLFQKFSPFGMNCNLLLC